ncbi:hypothetical protein [Salinibacter altiplanensis]|uniref:hypothetical protein n=1 Tax=Salinibacter altiplanensis TaxID=1803181 RepID=UPI000C9F8213|nr:hypothetical protein [Salinibacter altiplanensis]
MHHLRSSDTVGRWAVALGFLLVVGPLLRSVTPCRGAAAPDDAASAAVVAAVASEAQWTCSEKGTVATVRAVPSERSTFSLDGPSGGGSVGPASAESPSVSLNAQRLLSPPPVSPTVHILRPVVLQI